MITNTKALEEGTELVMYNPKRKAESIVEDVEEMEEEAPARAAGKKNAKKAIAKKKS